MGFGDDIDTDIIIPTEYLALKTIDDMKQYGFSPLRPELAARSNREISLLQERTLAAALPENRHRRSSRHWGSSVLSQNPLQGSSFATPLTTVCFLLSSLLSMMTSKRGIPYLL